MPPQESTPPTQSNGTDAAPLSANPPQSGGGVLPSSPLVPDQPAATPMPSPTGKKHKRGVILGIVGGVIVVLAALVALLMPPIVNTLQANDTSNSFMSDITTGKVSAAAKLTDGGSANTAFLQQASHDVSGSFSLQTATTQSQNGQHYFLYTLRNSTNKHARTILKKESGGWKVTSFVYGPSSLKLIPGSSEQTSMSATTAPSTATSSSDATTATSTEKCLTAQEALSISDDEGADSEVAQGYFNPDATTFAYPNVTNPLFQKLADFYKSHKSATFAFHVVVSEYEGNGASASDQTLAAQRAQTIKTDLQNAGIPASYIVVDSPYLQSDPQQDPATAEVDRSFSVNLDTTCS